MNRPDLERRRAERRARTRRRRIGAVATIAVIAAAATAVGVVALAWIYKIASFRLAESAAAVVSGGGS